MAEDPAPGSDRSICGYCNQGEHDKCLEGKVEKSKVMGRCFCNHTIGVTIYQHVDMWICTKCGWSGTDPGRMGLHRVCPRCPYLVHQMLCLVTTGCKVCYPDPEKWYETMLEFEKNGLQPGNLTVMMAPGHTHVWSLLVNGEKGWNIGCALCTQAIPLEEVNRSLQLTFNIQQLNKQEDQGGLLPWATRQRNIRNEVNQWLNSKDK